MFFFLSFFLGIYRLLFLENKTKKNKTKDIYFIKPKVKTIIDVKSEKPKIQSYQTRKLLKFLKAKNSAFNLEKLEGSV